MVDLLRTLDIEWILYSKTNSLQNKFIQTKFGKNSHAILFKSLQYIIPSAGFAGQQSQIIW